MLPPHAVLQNFVL